MWNVSLLAQDVLVALKLAFDESSASYAQLGNELGLSASQVHAAVRRAEESGLVNAETRKVNRRALTEFLVHGLKYVFPARRGPIVRGIPTAHAAPPLSDLLSDAGPSLVWPDPSGDVRGESIEPLHKSVPGAVRKDSSLYRSLALIDAIRVGRARDRKIATKKLQEMIQGGR